MPAGPITTREDAEGDAVREFTPRDASRTYAGAADDPFARLDLKPGRLRWTRTDRVSTTLWDSSSA